MESQASTMIAQTNWTRTYAHVTDVTACATERRLGALSDRHGGNEHARWQRLAPLSRTLVRHEIGWPI